MKFNKKIIETKKGDTLYVAVSMGEDSVAMAHFLSKGFRRICLVHVDHGTNFIFNRESSKRFADFVHYLNINRQSKYPVTGILKVNPDRGENLSESELRDIRYKLIEEVVQQNSDSGEVIICHHLGDCVESYLMNCFNGVPEYAPIPVITDRGQCRIIRPFITTSKQDIVNYIHSNKLNKWIVQDPSNNDTEYSRRNWLRHIIIPQIKENYAGIETVVRKRVETHII